MKIEIEKRDNGQLWVWKDGKTTGHLSFGELIEQVIALLEITPMKGGFRMQTPEEWEEADYTITLGKEDENGRHDT